MEHRAAGIERLELILHIQRGKHILGVAHGQMAGVGIIWRPALVCGDDIGIARLIVLGQAVGGGFRRGRFQVIEVAVLLLIIGEALAHMLQHPDGKVLRFLVGEILAQPIRVQPRFVHAHKPNGGEMVVETAEIPLGIGVQSLLQKLFHRRALDLQAAGGNIHHAVQPDEEVRFILGKVRDAGQIDGHDAHGAGGLAAAEEAAAFLAQLPQIQPQTAAHAAHIAGFHIGIDIVGEIRRAVFGGHLKEQAVVLRLGPVKILGDGIGGDGILEAAAVGVAFDHDLNKGLVDEVHLRLAVAVGEVHGLAAHDAGLVGQVGGYRPVQRDVGKRSLRSPAAGRIDAEHKALDAVLDLVVAELVRAHKGRKIGVEAGKRLRPSPLVLHDAEEIHHLVAQRRQMPRRRAGDLAGHAAKPFLNKLF